MREQDHRLRDDRSSRKNEVASPITVLLLEALPYRDDDVVYPVPVGVSHGHRPFEVS